MIFNFFINKISQANKLSGEKIPTCANLALVTFFVYIKDYFRSIFSWLQFSQKANEFFYGTSALVSLAKSKLTLLYLLEGI